MKLIVVAMENEIKEFLDDTFKLIKEKPFKIYQKNGVLVLITNVGKVNASFALTSTLINFRDITTIINVGFAGATKPLKVDDVVGVLSATYHDFDLTVFGYAHGQVPNLPVYYESDSNLLNKISKRVKFKKTNLYTGDYFMSGANSTNGFLVDMEGAALFQVAYLSNIPMVSFKIVSDIVNETDQLKKYQEFESKKGAITIKEVLYNILEVL